MNLSELIKDFQGAIATAASEAPDQYPKSSYWTYETNMADIKDIWSKINLKATINLPLIFFIDEKLKEAFSSFENGEKERGRNAMWDIYNAQLENI